MSHDPIVDPAPTSITTTSSVPATIPAPAPLALSAPAPPITAFQAVSATAVVPGSVGTRCISSALRALPQHQASSLSTSSSTAAAALDITIAVAVYPLVIPGPYEPAGYGTRKLRAQNEHMLDYYNRFQQHGLLFTLKVPASGIMSPTDFTSAILHKQPWAILQPTRRADVITFNSHPTISATMFGIEEFQKLNKKCKNPDPTTGADRVLIFIGDRIPSDFAHPFCQFLFNVMDMQPTLIDSPRTQEVHDSWTITFMSKVLLGTTTLWTHPEFLALQRGFNIRVGATTIVEKFTADHDALPMLACLYDREVKSIDQIMSRVTWRILMRASDGTTPYFGALFRILLFRYLNGVGHPEQLRGGLVDEEEWSKQVNNHLLHTKLLLETGSDNDLLPTGDSWGLQVFHITGLDPSPASMETTPCALHFHTCMYEIDIKITRPMEDMLIAACTKLDDLIHSTVFDVWLHAQLLSRDHNTA
ncbi:hypothetical protein B0H10DRAFT_2208442 [Mycena sp. CBHHK59/15]|nr:hypothetical protein B0H10DRAFT_2208442 [Mycena sp. CBHHK59/15]